MRSYEQLRDLWADSPAPPTGRGTVVALNRRPVKRQNEACERLDITVEQGVVGDHWSTADEPDVNSQVSIINARVAELVCDGEHGLHTPGDNIVADFDLSEAALPVGTRVRAGTALLEVSPEPHTGCKLFRSRFGAEALRWVNHKDQRDQRFRGVYCKVLEAGAVSVGDTISVEE